MAKSAFVYAGYAGDGAAYGERIAKWFRENKFEVRLFSLQQPATFAVIQQMHPDVLYFDMPLDLTSLGWSLLDQCMLDKRLSRMPIIIASGDVVNPALAAQFEKAGVRLLTKPVLGSDIVTALKEIDAAWTGNRDSQGRPLRRQGQAQSDGCLLIPIASIACLIPVAGIAMLALSTRRR